MTRKEKTLNIRNQVIAKCKTECFNCADFLIGKGCRNNTYLKYIMLINYYKFAKEYGYYSPSKKDKIYYFDEDEYWNEQVS